MKQLLESGAAVILLGCAEDTAGIIRALNREYGIAPVLFGERRLRCLLPVLRYRFVRCLMPGNRYYVIHSILDIAAQPHDVRTVLIPCTSQFEKYVATYIDIFENEYILRSRAQLSAALISPKKRSAEA